MKKNETAFRVRVLVLALIILANLSLFMLRNLNLFKTREVENLSVQVLKIEKSEGEAGAHALAMKKIQFTAEILSGPKKGETIQAEQQMTLHGKTIKEIKVGDKILVQKQPGGHNSQIWVYTLHRRLPVILWASLVFVLLILIFGRAKGAWALIALLLTFGIIFFVFIPSVIHGYNIYLWSSITCIYSVVVTILLVSAQSAKSLVTILGCTFGILVAAAITLFLDRFLELTGFVDEQSVYLWMLKPDQPINLAAVIFGAIIIGAMGAIMDVAMDISSSLYEITLHAPDVKFKPLFNSGLTIGRDVMGTMINTLVLAYIGSSLSGILLLLTYSTSLWDLLNREVIIVEMLQALTGSIAILLTMPLTALFASIIYRHPRFKRAHPVVEEE